jgi:hypothetical protein
MPLSATRAAIPSCVLAPLQGFLRKSCPRLSTGTSPIRILLPFGACVPAESTYPRASHRSGYGPRSGFLTLFAGCSSTGLAGLFHPTNALRLSPSGISPPEEQRRLFARALPSCRSPEVGLPRPRCGTPGAPPSLPREWGNAFYRLHGFALLESPFRTRPCLVVAPAEPLLGFLLSRVCPPVTMQRFITAAPPVRLSPAYAPRVSPWSVRGLRCGVSFVPVVASSLSRPPSPPEVHGHRPLSIRRRAIRAYRFASSSRWRCRSV